MLALSLLADADTQSAAFKMGEKFGALIGVGIMLGLLALFVVSLVQSIRRKSAGWIVTAVLSGLVSLLLVLGSIAAVVVGQQARAKAKVPKAAVSNDGAVTLQVPGDWSTMTAPSGAILQAGNQGFSENVVVISIPKKNFPGDLAALEQAVTEGTAKRFKATAVSEPASEPVGAYPAMRRTIDGESEGANMIFHLTYVETKDSFYEVLCWSPKRKDPVTAPGLKKIADSFAAKAGPPDVPATAEGKAEEEKTEKE